MSGVGKPRVVTANDLFEGDAVWLTASGAWSRRLAEAHVVESDDEAERRLSEAQAQAHAVVGAYLAEVIATPAGPKPAHFREAFRTRGPSNYPHGKQAHPPSEAATGGSRRTGDQ